MSIFQPTIDLNRVGSEDARAIAGRIVATKGPTKGRLLVSRPKDDEAYYVWRMVSFYIGATAQSQCLPLGAIDALPSAYVDHRPPCGRAARTYGAYQEAFDRETGMYDNDGNYRTDCSCGAENEMVAKKAHLEDVRSRLDAIVDAIVATVPVQQRYGLRRWGRAMTGVDPGANASDADVCSPMNFGCSPEDELEGVML